MVDYSMQNKKAWEYNAYEFWVKQSGTPVDRAKRNLENTVFDISEDNKRYALEVATAAGVDLNFEVCDILEIDEFMRIMYSLLKDNGKMICSDFHPFTKISYILNFEQPTMSYFSEEVFEGEMAHARFFEKMLES